MFVDAVAMKNMDVLSTKSGGRVAAHCLRIAHPSPHTNNSAQYNTELSFLKADTTITTMTVVVCRILTH